MIRLHQALIVLYLIYICYKHTFNYCGWKAYVLPNRISEVELGFFGCVLQKKDQQKNFFWLAFCSSLHICSGKTKSLEKTQQPKMNNENYFSHNVVSPVNTSNGYILFLCWHTSAIQWLYTLVVVVSYAITPLAYNYKAIVIGPRPEQQGMPCHWLGFKTSSQHL